MEIWKPVKDYEGLYEVSSIGNVRSVERDMPWIYDSIRRLPSKPRKQFIDKSGYYRVRLSKKRAATTCAVHRLVALAFIPNPENKPTVNHKDGNKINNSAENLEWATVLENSQHAYAAGLTPIGDQTPNGKKTHCKWGHEFTEENTRRYNGSRQCVTCVRKRQKGEYWKKKVVTK